MMRKCSRPYDVFKLGGDNTENSRFVSSPEVDEVIEKCWGEGKVDLLNVIQDGLKLQDVKTFEPIKCPKLQMAFEFNAHYTMFWRNQSFEYVFPASACQDSRDYSTVIVLNPEDLLHVENFLDQVSGFYINNPARVSSFYFFVIWRNNLESSPSKVERILKSWNHSIPIESHLYILLETPKIMGVQIWEHYSAKEEQVFQKVEIGNFMRRTMRRNDFKGVVIKALVQDDPSLRYYEIYEKINGSLVYTGGLAADLFKTLANFMNFTPKFVNGNGWITIENGTLQGMAKQLIAHEGDIILSVSEILRERYDSLQIVASQPVHSLGVYAYFRRPEPDILRNVLLEAFKPKLWGAIVATSVILIASIIFIKYVKFKFCSKLSPADEQVTESVILCILAACCQIGWYCTPSSPSLQVVTIVALVSSLLYYTAYSASIVSIFSVEINRFRSLEDLDQHGYTLYGNSLSQVGLWEVEERTVRDGVPSNSRIVAPVEGIKKIMDGSSAFLSSRNLFILIIAQQSSTAEDDKCSFITRTTQSLAIKQHHAFFYRKFESIKKFIGFQLSKHRERGLLFRTKLEYYRLHNPECDPKPKTKSRQLSLHDTRSAFLVLGWGYISCLIILAIELVSCAYRNRIKMRPLAYLGPDE
ncbi:unnamed protein product [Allacma fusca]|uniref:Ionotropic glutamate receptor C-terminal domain-containing protein n=1 Tax=Allacma fusca TaxID=39272 RepID=A0A8J2NWL9_9HEXA|nr:unnamed protein product [Allacma fusca]